MIKLDTNDRSEATNPKPVPRLSAASAEAARAASADASSTSKANSNQSTSAQPKPSSPAEFAALLQELIGPSKEVSEEQLFAGLLQERIISSKGLEAGTQYRNLLEEQKRIHTYAEGNIGYEEAANAALAAFVRSGALTQAEADTLHAQSFGAAQLDDNKYTLWDGHGTDNDPTVAVGSLEKALVSAKSQLDLYQQGLAVPLTAASATDLSKVVKNETTGAHAVSPLANLASAANSQVATGNKEVASTTEHAKKEEEQLAEEEKKAEAEKAKEAENPVRRGLSFRPRSVADDNVIVRLPENLANKIRDVRITDVAGNILEVARADGPGKADSRERFRFSKPGDGYPAEIRVEAQLENGATRSWKVQDAKERYEGLAGVRGKKKQLATS
jgi:hypothetical protein